MTLVGVGLPAEDRAWTGCSLLLLTYEVFLLFIHQAYYYGLMFLVHVWGQLVLRVSVTHIISNLPTDSNTCVAHSQAHSINYLASCPEHVALVLTKCLWVLSLSCSLA